MCFYRSEQISNIMIFHWIRYNKGSVDKSKKTAGTHSGSSRTVNLGIAKDGIYHPLEV